MDQELSAVDQTSFADNLYAGFFVLLYEAYDLIGAVTQSEFISYFEGIVPDSNFFEYFAFDELQVKLLKLFLVVLVCNSVLILFTWNVYGKRISNRFMKSATSKAIEDLKKSASMLKLPKEHNPRV